MKFSKTERRLQQDIFGDMKKYHVTTDAETLKVGDEVTITNNNCEFEFDNVFGVFQTDLFFVYIADLEIVKVDYSEFEPDKSNNGGKYAYATCKVVKVYDKSY